MSNTRSYNRILIKREGGISISLIFLIPKEQMSYIKEQTRLKIYFVIKIVSYR